MDLGDVGAWLIETQEIIVVVNLFGDVIWEIFEVLKRVYKISVHGVDVL